MEKLLEQEALMEQQDPKVRSPPTPPPPWPRAASEPAGKRGPAPDLHTGLAASFWGWETGQMDLSFVPLFRKQSKAVQGPCGLSRFLEIRD